MPKEITILIPETGEKEAIDIKVMTSGKELVNYRLVVFDYPVGKTNKSRADFVKEKIDLYQTGFEVVEIGRDGESLVPVLFRQMDA